MAINVRATGAWAEYTTDLQTVVIPATPQAGDRMFLWVQWKDQGIILAVPSGWTSIGTYSDGTVATGNGSGSMRQQVFYRDWQSGDANPTLDFSTTTGLLAEAVITVWSKDVAQTWDSPPPFATAPHSWTTTATTTAATASSQPPNDPALAIPSLAVVMCGVAVRDDSAAMTRGLTVGIDVASGITWLADYVEAPSTHYTTVTGNDHSGDLGYRKVNAGGTVTLRATGTLSAAETGSLVWVVQSVTTLGTPYSNRYSQLLAQ